MRAGMLKLDRSLVRLGDFIATVPAPDSCAMVRNRRDSRAAFIRCTERAVPMLDELSFIFIPYAEDPLGIPRSIPEKNN